MDGPGGEKEQSLISDQTNALRFHEVPTNAAFKEWLHPQRGHRSGIQGFAQGASSMVDAWGLNPGIFQTTLSCCPKISDAVAMLETPHVADGFELFEVPKHIGISP